MTVMMIVAICSSVVIRAWAAVAAVISCHWDVVIQCHCHRPWAAVDWAAHYVAAAMAAVSIQFSVGEHHHALEMEWVVSGKITSHACHSEAYH